MLAAFAYLLISGAAFATVRSTIMIAIMSWPRYGHRLTVAVAQHPAARFA